MKRRFYESLLQKNIYAEHLSHVNLVKWRRLSRVSSLLNGLQRTTGVLEVMGWNPVRWGLRFSLSRVRKVLKIYLSQQYLGL